MLTAIVIIMLANLITTLIIIKQVFGLRDFLRLELSFMETNLKARINGFLEVFKKVRAKNL